MANHARRELLYLSISGAAALVFGCRDELASDGTDTNTGTDTGDGDPCDESFTDATLLAVLGFEGEDDAAVGVQEGTGLDSRLAVDLSTLDAGTLITTNEDFFVRTGLPDQLDLGEPWRIDISGLVDVPLSLDILDVPTLPQTSRVVLLECSGNGSNRGFGLISAAEWTGVLLSTVLELAIVRPEATAVLVEGFDQHSQPSSSSTPGCSWVFRLHEIADAGAMLATHMNGEPLPPDHGAPVRLIIPGWYGCCNPKWVDAIRLVDDTEPATAQMLEFASRTHQTDAHALAADYAPAIMQQAAMPIRIEKWRRDGEVVYRIVGIMWGGTELTDALAIRFDGGEPIPVALCEPIATNDTWTLWSYVWRPPAPGEYEITMAIADPAIATIRLDSGYYARRVIVDEI